MYVRQISRQFFYKPLVRLLLRFPQCAGVPLCGPPIGYLTGWRYPLAADLVALKT